MFRALLVGATLVIMGMVLWELLVGVVLVLGAAYAVRRFHGHLLTQAAERKAREQELVERADREHGQILNGNDDGIYGKYPPATIPGVIDDECGCGGLC